MTALPRIASIIARALAGTVLVGLGVAFLAGTIGFLACATTSCMEGWPL